MQSEQSDEGWPGTVCLCHLAQDFPGDDVHCPKHDGPLRVCAGYVPDTEPPPDVPESLAFARALRISLSRGNPRFHQPARDLIREP